jgi:hypothetical protein
MEESIFCTFILHPISFMPVIPLSHSLLYLLKQSTKLHLCASDGSTVLNTELPPVCVHQYSFHGKGMKTTIHIVNHKLYLIIYKLFTEKYLFISMAYAYLTDTT